MPQVVIDLTYSPVEHMISLIDQPHQRICRRILSDNRELFEKAQGSTHNHQAWEGGYIDHVAEVMNYARPLYALERAIGRPVPFSLSDVLLVMYLHDLEKPWRIEIRDGKAYNRPGLETKEQFKAFREKKLAEYGLVLNEMQFNALTYVEGEYKDYSSTHRVMNELAGFCHMVDVWSARDKYNYPKAKGDEWAGAGRFRKLPWR